MSGATALISSRVGMRRSANWNSVQPPITLTHCGGGVRAGLLLQQAQRVRERRHAVPAQFQVVVEAAPDGMHVRIVETGNDGSAPDVNHFASLAHPAAESHRLYR